MKAFGFDTKAPTGHKSMTLPDISESRAVSKYVPICMSFPRPVEPSSGAPATSFANRIHLVQWIHLFIDVLMRGPIFLSSTARLPLSS